MTLTPGDRVPFWAAVGLDRSFHSTDAQMGRACVLIVADARFRPALDPLLTAFAAGAPAFAACDCDLLVLLPFAAIPALYGQGDAAVAGLPVRLYRDAFDVAYGIEPGGARVIVVDRAGRVAVLADPAGIAPAEIVGVAHAAAAALQAEPSPAAPALLIPRLFDPALCRRIIDGFEAAATFDSPVSGAGADRVDHARKQRRDWLLIAEDALHEEVTAILRRRCLPELNRAFVHEAAHFDRILVARYDAGAGHFRRHRDNTAASVAFRQFALSVNLNTPDYEGGALRFPEFDTRLHAPPAGAGIVFSASLLHEVTDVTAGRRYVLLTFLHDAAAEARRTSLHDTAADNR